MMVALILFCVVHWPKDEMSESNSLCNITPSFSVMDPKGHFLFLLT